MLHVLSLLEWPRILPARNAGILTTPEGITQNLLEVLVGAGGGTGESFCLFKPAVPCFRPPLPSNAFVEALCALTGAMRHDDDDEPRS